MLYSHIEENQRVRESKATKPSDGDGKPSVRINTFKRPHPNILALGDEVSAHELWREHSETRILSTDLMVR